MKKIIAMMTATLLLFSISGCSLTGATDLDAASDRPVGSAKGCTHSFTVTGTMDPGCENEGNVHILCTTCGAQYTALQSPVGHDWADAACDAPMTCHVCGLTQGEPLGHTYSAGECTMCGAPDPDNSIQWDLSKGVLTLTGVGRMKDEVPWYDYRSSIKEVVIPDGITYIGRGAFASTKIVELVLPDSVTELGEQAFYWPGELTTVILPDGIEVLPDRVFGQCEKLSYVKFPAHLKKIGEFALGACAIEELVLPYGLEEIGESAFLSSRKLRTVDIPGTVTMIGKDAFKGCVALTTVTIGDGAGAIGYKAFGDCKSLTHVYIPASVTQIDEYAFENSINVVIYGAAGSYAETFAADNGIPFVAG